MDFLLIKFVCLNLKKIIIYFIESITRVDLQNEMVDDSLFYSTFIAAENTPYQTSAICLFSLSQINKVFNFFFN
jgi:hypothetical protein